jgi:2-methylcitrate dehydratase PrpD
VICRLARALGTTSYDRGFHTTGTAGIFGVIAAVAKVKNLPTHMVQTTFGIAGSKAAGSMSFMQNGSWNKRLHPGFAAHDALLCIALVEAGVKGSLQPFEGKAGFLHAYSEKPIMEGLVDGLGEEWVFLHTALKPYPSCRATHTSIELAAKMSRHKEVPVESITIALTRSAWSLVGLAQANKIRPENIVDAQFSNYAQTAIAWLYGSDLGWEIYDKIYEPKVQQLAARVRCIVDNDQPQLGAKMTVRWQDGSVSEEAVPYPLGEAENPFVSEKVQAKYLNLTRSVYGDKNAIRILDIILTLERHGALDLMSLL